MFTVYELVDRRTLSNAVDMYASPSREAAERKANYLRRRFADEGAVIVVIESVDFEAPLSNAMHIVPQCRIGIEPP